MLLSSHLLREVEAVADGLVVIGDGRIVAQGAKDELLAGSGVFVRAPDQRATRRARSTPNRAERTPRRWRLHRRRHPRDRRRATAADAGVAVLELRPANAAGLEQLFLTLTADDPSGVAA